ncbi:LacI family DNA-binding transcriptional regulator [uncultured Sunxiuqinia sp.]|uniref:LacI family DNA-binding transcriptional regulator n=1 Tax=uncultured Sunxiuqinia sp. TaxID=1573825 RepID=UPI002AA8B30D|nr:LacI family DNA-binding transcriptional regulator [uncultured Sunxiuqinia sp.]
MGSLNDVAKKAGVSIATVSRVINNGSNVNEVTRARVLNAIKELRYQPSRVAKRLRSKSVSSNLIGVLIPDIQNPFYVDVLRGIEDVTYENNYALIMCNFQQDEKKEKLYLDILQSESIDGLIAAPAHEKDAKVISLVKEGLPIVCFDRGLQGVDVDVVLVNNREGAFKAVDYLAKVGYKRIALISGLEQLPSSQLRDSGYREALKENGLAFDPKLIKHGDSKHESAVRLCDELLSSENPPDAIFTGNNLITLGALETIHKRKLNIPEDIAIIGFDDMYWSISLNPPLTAVYQPAYEIGRRCAELLIQRIKDPQRPSIQMILNTQLMIRSSC